LDSQFSVTIFGNKCEKLLDDGRFWLLDPQVSQASRKFSYRNNEITKSKELSKPEKEFLEYFYFITVLSIQVFLNYKFND